MGETYTSLGPMLPWTCGGGLLLGVLISAVWTLLSRKKPLPTKSLIVGALFGIVLMIWAARIPLAVGFPLMIFYFGAAVLFSKSKPEQRRLKFAFVGTFILMGVLALFVLLGTFRETIVFSQDEVAWHTDREDGKAPRQGLRVHAVGPDRAWYSNGYFSWTVFSGHDIGPHILGFGLYKGPDGVINGDELGVHLAKWAGTKPEYKTLEQLDAEIAAYKSASN